MSSFLSIPIIGNTTQAVNQVQSRLDSAFGRRRIEMEFVRDDDGVVIELIVEFEDSLPEEEIRAFRRSLENIKDRVGVPIMVPVGSSGGVNSAGAFEFTTAGFPVGFTVVGNVTVGGNLATGPNTIFTDGGGGGALDLSTTPVTAGLPIVPGTLTIDTTISATTETIVDDGAGGLSDATALPGDGTINYVTGAMTGTTAALDASSTVDESHTTDVSLSAPFSVVLDSGAAAGDAALALAPNKSVGQVATTLEWSFNVNFAPDFGLNNNSVSGAQALVLEARLLGAASGSDIVLRWSEVSDDASPPTDWGTPAFAGVRPTSAPTGALAIDMDAIYHSIAFRKAGDKVLGVAYDGAEELFTFAEDIVVPSKLTINHNWGDDLDRYFTVDDWSLAYTLSAPA